jgi:hypothetical protein
MYNKLLDHQLQQHSVKSDMVPGYFIPVLQVVSDEYDRYEMISRLGVNAVDSNGIEITEPGNKGVIDNYEKVINVEKGSPFQYDEKEKRAAELIIANREFAFQNEEKDHRTKKIPVAILTSSKEDPDIQQCYDLGANGYVVKPVEFDEFEKTISDLGLYWMLVNQPSQ